VKHSDILKAALGLMICLASACCSPAFAADEFRFTSWTEEGLRFRFDNQSGEICKLVKVQSGQLMWLKCEIAEQKPIQTSKQSTMPSIQYPTAPIMPAAPIAIQRSAPAPMVKSQAASLIEPDDLMASGDIIPSPKPAPSGVRQIQVYDEFNNNITNVLDDSARSACRATINGYDALRLSHTLKTSGDSISGIVIIENKGNRKIAKLELTLVVRVVGKEKAIEHKRFLFSDSGDGDRPPVPSFGSSGMSVMKKIDVPTPSGVISGMPEVRVTYLAFDDKE